MPLFISEEELRRSGGDTAFVVEKAEGFIRELQRQLETSQSQADAAAITYEQSCTLVEQKYVSLSADFSELQARCDHLAASLEQSVGEIAQLKSEKHQLSLKHINKDGEIEKLSLQVSELHKSKRQLLEIVEQKEIEISDKNALCNGYLQKIVYLTDDINLKDAKLHECQAEFSRSQSAHTRLLQEKEILERHNQWLNEELTSKINDLLELRRSSTENVADLSAKLSDVEKRLEETTNSLNSSRERAKGLEEKLASSQEELCASRNMATDNEHHFSAEISTATKLVDLYKKSSEEWSKKSSELEGVIKALETHLSQVEGEYKEKLERQVSQRNDLEKEVFELREKLNKCELELDNARKTHELDLPFLSIAAPEDISVKNDLYEGGERMLVPRFPVGVSGTALATALLRDGWSLATMYTKYQETADALRHEKLGRKQSQAILERVLKEIEEKAEIVLEERAEHEKIVDAYNLLEEKLQKALSDQALLENDIRELKAEIRRRERDFVVVEKEIRDLEDQVTVLLKECQDIQIRCGNTASPSPFGGAQINAVRIEADSSANLLAFKDIHGLVEQNVQLRGLVHTLELQRDQRDSELKVEYKGRSVLRAEIEMEIKKHEDAAASKVEVVLKRSEEQNCMIESLHTSVAMYKRLYEEEFRRRGSTSAIHTIEYLPEDGKKDNLMAFERSQLDDKRADVETASLRVKELEGDLLSARKEVTSLQLERDKLIMEAKFTQERFDRFLNEFEDLKKEATGVRSRNVELSQLIIDYQKRLRENSQFVQSSEEMSRKLSMQVSTLQHEKDLLANSEKRAMDEVRVLSERAHRLQASLDTFHSIEEVRENARADEKRKLEADLQRMQKEWAEAKKELQDERRHAQNLALDREQTLRNAIQQVEDMRKELAQGLQAVTNAEARAALFESRCADLETKLKRFESGVDVGGGGQMNSACLHEDGSLDIEKLKEEMRSLKEEAQSSREHMLQFKNIAQVNEEALKQIECAHESFKDESDKMKMSLESEITSLKEQISQLESNSTVKALEFSSAISEKEAAHSLALCEISSLKDQDSLLRSQNEEMRIRISSLKEDLEKEHQHWRSAQDNYERQVILQSEAIQELRKTSDAFAVLQKEASELRTLAGSLKDENDSLRSSWEKEKAQLQQFRDEAERKYNEINEQNNILLNRLGAVSIKIAEKERVLSGLSTEGSVSESRAEEDLQTVINYLRRSKEIAETEISLLKQEKLRLQTQLEGALKASEASQNLLQAERVKARNLVFSDEEFRSLQLQVREINLLRESNMQLREENKHNFDECQRLIEAAHKAKAHSEQLDTLLSKKETELEACTREIDMQKMEIVRWESKNSEVIERYKNINLEEYDRMKDDFCKIQERLAKLEVELKESQAAVIKDQEKVSALEKEIAGKDLKLSEMQQNMEIQQKQKNTILHWKRKAEGLAREKDELIKEKQAISNQLEESKAVGKRSIVEASKHETASRQELVAHHEQALKEKDTRIQSLEKIFERAKEDLQKERDELRKEKAGRAKDQKAFMDFAQKSIQAKKDLMEELDRHKRLRESLAESGTSAGQLPSDMELDEKMTTYLQFVDQIDEAKSLPFSDAFAARAVSSTPSIPVDLTTNDGRTGRPAVTLSIGSEPPNPPPKETSEKKVDAQKSIIQKGRPGRRLIRPKLGVGPSANVTVDPPKERSEPTTAETLPLAEHSEPAADIDVPEVEGDINLLEENRAIPPDGEISDVSTVSIFTRKRSPFSDSHEEAMHDTKKSKCTDSTPDYADDNNRQTSSENPELVLPVLDDIPLDSSAVEGSAKDANLESEADLAPTEALGSDLETASGEPIDAGGSLGRTGDADDSFDGGCDDIAVKDMPAEIDEEKEEGELSEPTQEGEELIVSVEQPQTPPESEPAGSDVEEEGEIIASKGGEVTSATTTAPDPEELPMATADDTSVVSGNDDPPPAALQDPTPSGPSDPVKHGSDSGTTDASMQKLPSTPDLTEMGKEKASTSASATDANKPFERNPGIGTRSVTRARASRFVRGSPRDAGGRRGRGRPPNQ